MVIDEWCERFGEGFVGGVARGGRRGREREEGSDAGEMGRGLDTDGEDWGEQEGGRMRRKEVSVILWV